VFQVAALLLDISYLAELMLNDTPEFSSDDIQLKVTLNFDLQEGDSAIFESYIAEVLERTGSVP
jgi:hypothetical protein